MDSASFQSSSKCSGSDFSIKRILGDTRSNEEGCTGAPSWLCCTRYQPPRLPRNNNISGGRARRSGRHARVPFTGAQAAALEAAYSRAHYLAPPALRALAAALHLRDDRIKIWFQNRRARERREKNGTVTPPKTMTLQPSTEFRIPSQEGLPNFWNRLDSPTSDAALIVKQTTTNKPVSSCSISSYNKPFSKLHEPDNDNSRCETPVDIETVD